MITILIVLILAWVSALWFGLSLCQAAARGDRMAGRE